MTRGPKLQNQRTEREQDLFARASFRCGGFWSVALVAELITQKGGERLKLRNRCVQQLPRCNHHRRLSLSGLHFNPATHASPRHRSVVETSSRGPWKDSRRLHRLV